MKHAISPTSSSSLAPAALVLLASLVPGCGGQQPDAQAPQGAAPADAPVEAAAATEAATKPADIATLAAREVATPLAKAPVELPVAGGGSLKIDVEAASAPKANLEGDIVALTIPLGTKQPVQCDIYKSRIDNAGSLARMLADIGKKVTVTAARTTDVQAKGHAPLLSAEADYTVSSKPAEPKPGQKAPPPEVRQGLFKMALRSSDSHSFLCTHNELGYRETFKRVVAGLSEALAPAVKTAPQLVLIDAVRQGGAAVGFREQRVVNDPKGGRIIETFEAWLTPKAPSEFVGQDLSSRVLVERSGGVLGGSFVRTQNGELVSEVTLRKKGAKEYAYDGKESGKPIKGAFKASKDITTDVSRAPALKAFAAGKDEETTFVGYAPAVDAAAPREEKFQKKGDALLVTAGSSNLKVKLDASGLLEKAEPATPDATAIVYERLEARGAL
jgi:hypothetical protein